MRQACSSGERPACPAYRYGRRVRVHTRACGVSPHRHAPGRPVFHNYKAHPCIYLSICIPPRPHGRARSVQGTSRWWPPCIFPEKGRSARGPGPAASGRRSQQDPGSIRNGPCPSTQSGSSADTALGRQQWRVCQHLFYRSPSELAACTALVRTD